MLVLTRKQNEKIQIGDQITITVLRMKGRGVRLGIQAPPEVSVLRGELAFEIAGEMEADDSNDGRSAISPAHSASRLDACEYEATTPCWSI